MRRITVFITSTVIASFFLGCSFAAIDPDPPYIPPSLTSPAGTIELIGESFADRDIDELDKCLTSDLTFHFDEDNVGKQVGEYAIPESWASVDFLNAVSRTFDHAYSIDISIATSNIGDPGPDETTFTADNVQINFLVMVDTSNGYLAQGFVTFEFAAEYNEKDEKEWLVAAWRDFTSPAESGGRSITPASFGEILARFYKP